MEIKGSSRAMVKNCRRLDISSEVQYIRGHPASGCSRFSSGKSERSKLSLVPPPYAFSSNLTIELTSSGHIATCHAWTIFWLGRSEERRVGKECRSRWWRES